VLCDPDVELVFVSTINETHFGFAKACLLAGKHCVVEKPLTPTSKEAWELAKLAKEKSLILAVYQNRRWDSDFLTVKALIEKGAFGELSEFESHYDRFKNEAATNRFWKETALPGSGAAYDLGSHLIDQVLYLFGKPTSVTGIVRNSRTIGQVHDSFVVHIHYEATDKPGRQLPLLATVQGSILSRVAPQLRFVVKGTDAAFVKYGLDVQEEQLKAGAAAAISMPDFGVEPVSLQGTLYTATESHKLPTLPGTYAAWFYNVFQSIRAKDPSLLVVTPEQAALTIQVVEAALESSQSGRKIDL